jgi:pimeloyl-ACP methyl ester carboxylesterase
MTAQSNSSGQIPPEGEGRVGEPLREIPIVVVPGIMGTRLVRRNQGNSTLVWNPAGSAFIGAPDPCDAHPRTSEVDILARTDQPLHPDQGHWSFRRIDSGAHRRWLKAGGLHPPGFDPESSPLDDFNPNQSFGTPYSLISYYLRLCEELTRLDLSAAGLRPRVVCAGYDWRQSNDRSAGTLAQVIERAKRHCSADQVILVAHSMGGLVSRYYARFLGPQNVRALFLVGSPALGAPDAYVTLKEGPADVEMDVVLFGMGGIGFTENGRHLCRLVPSVFQLLPTSMFGNAHPNWLQFDERWTGYSAQGNGTGMRAREEGRAFSDCRDARRLYQDLYTGIADGSTARDAGNWGHHVQNRQMCLAFAEQAANFHDRLVENGVAWMPPRTFHIYVRGRETLDAARLASMEPVVNQHGTWFLEDDNTPPGVDPESHDVGDETVPRTSAYPPLSRAEAGHFEANDKHATMPSHPSVIDYIKTQIRAEVGA